MSVYSPPPSSAPSGKAKPWEDHETGSVRQESPTLPQSRTSSKLVGGCRKDVFTSVDKASKPSEITLDKRSPAYQAGYYEDSILREAFDFGSLQNLQDGPFHHRPINLRDLEILESDKFIMPPQELCNQARKRSNQVRRDQSCADDQLVPTRLRCNDDRAAPEALSSGVSDISVTPHARSSTAASSSPSLSTDIIINPSDCRQNAVNANGMAIIDQGQPPSTHSFKKITLQITRPVPNFAKMAALSTLRTALGVLNALLEPSKRKSTIPRDRVRIRWTCKCGKRLFDDFIEKSPGAARRLELHLNRPRQRPDGKGSETNSTSTFSSLSRFPSSSNSTAASSVDLGDISTARDLNCRTPYVPFLATPGSQKGTDTGPFPEQLWLLTCAERQKFTTKLIHLDMDSQKVISDKEFALLVKAQYSKLRPSWRQFMRLRGLHTIQFVQFEVHRSQVVDIRKCPDLPGRSNINYKFVPSDVLPPVGENYLMHLFHHPEDYEDELITYKRIPKKRGMKLRICDRADVGVGWGVHLVEGFLAYKVWSLFTGIFVLASLVFAIVWTTQKGDIQGAFGVAAYVCALSTLLIGCVMAYLE